MWAIFVFLKEIIALWFSQIELFTRKILNDLVE